MIRWGRKKQSVLCSLFVIIGVLCIIILTTKAQKMQALVETSETEEKQALTVTNEEKPMALDVTELYKYQEAELTKENVELAAEKLLGSSYLIRTELTNAAKPYKVALIYYFERNDTSYGKVKKDQLVLVNAVALMSLFEEIDTVSIKISRGGNQYEKVLYKPDIEDYFNVSIEDINDPETFERLATEFMDIDHVNAYWNMPHPYDSLLGEDAEVYFKEYFACENKDQLTLPAGQEKMEEDLVKKYGYHLFIEGLNYPNANMNYYCANKLIELYGTSNLEEMLLELVACKNKSDNEAVQNVCDFAKEILAYKDTGTPLLFTLFDETGGDGNIYGIINGRYGVFAKWQGSTKGRAQIISYSQNRKYALCQVNVRKNSYLYSLPLDGNNEYILDEEKASLNETKVSKELLGLITHDEEMKKQIKSEWLMGTFVKIQAEMIYIYNSRTQDLKREEEFNNNFSREDLIDSLFGYQSVILNVNEVSKGKTVTGMMLEDQHLSIYEFSSMQQKDKAIKQKEEPFLKANYIWSKGKVVVAYNGKNSNIISIISQIMK